MNLLELLNPIHLWSYACFFKGGVFKKMLEMDFKFWMGSNIPLNLKHEDF